MRERLTNSDIVELTEFRRALHRVPEISGEERETAKRVAAFIAPTKPDLLVTDLGGHGLAAVYDSGADGPTVMLRSELDALPIEEISNNPWRSQVPGKAHLCGHEGHTTILAACARQLGRERPKRGRVVLMFQPAEENGAGAAAVIADPKFASLAPDWAFSLHNFPGLPLGHAGLSAGPTNCASRGMRIVLTGRTAHASMPETGISPMAAVASLMPALTALAHDAKGERLGDDFALVTITHASMGGHAFGIAPGRAEIWATLRTLRDDRMAALVERAEALARDAASAGNLGLAIDYHDVFHHCDNAPEAVAIFRAAFDAEGVPHGEAKPLRASEDFGLFGRGAKSAMFWLGAGEDIPQLHNPDYDFPDVLIEPGTRVFMRVVRGMLG
ncbi:MAG: amidohydrolase [Rhizobiaceae bacterium]|nr:amidohydrolase [Rhizobiaceae bacterium]